jgi:NAD-dependent dihydropyrimidine dehydrogenase PreA subunit
MGQGQKLRIVLSFLVFLGLVVALSSVSETLWDEKPEKISLKKELVFQEGMKVSEFGKMNGLPDPLLKEVFGLASQEDLQKTVTEFHLSEEEILRQVNRAMALQSEHESKNWLKIAVKFFLWFFFLGFVFYLMRGRRVTSGSRKWLLLSGIILFGIVLGSDPSPMGTVKDAIALLAKSGAIFPPRAIALAIFLILVFLANKFICSWGCQFGTLQDFIFRLNRDSNDRKGVLKQFKPPFIVTNTARIVFIGMFTLTAFLWATDLVEPVDPFRIFAPAKIAWAGGLLIAAIAMASLFIYRPWCHFFCPFGLIGWLVEKKSLFKIKVNYDTCIACEACAKACPSTVMNAILKRERTIPDCFSCATCIETCPTHSINFDSGKRDKPPQGKFGTEKAQ